MNDGARNSRLGPPLAVHGGLDAAELRELGIDPANVLDFSANLNPFGPSPRVRDALAAVRLDVYPDRRVTSLCHRIAKEWDIAPSRVLVGNGASELLWLVGLAALRSGDSVAILGPTYAEYERIAAIRNACVANLDADEANGFRQDPATAAASLERIRPRLAFVCNPGNPTGTVLAPEILTSWVQRFPETLFCVDEAYLGFVVGARSMIETPSENLIVVRSMTKDHALAGVRLGYAVASRSWIDALARVQPPWSVNAFAQAAGIAALDDPDHLRNTMTRLTDATHMFVAAFTRIGCEPIASATHFFLVDVGNGAEVRRILLRRGILVRDCASFGLPAYIRIATRRPEENDRLVATLTEVRR